MWEIRQLWHPADVTSHSATVVGQPVAAYLRSRRRDLTDAVLRNLVDEIEIYARLPRELIQGDVRRVVERVLAGFADALAAGGLPTPAELAEIRASAERRAEEGVPMEMVMAAYFRGIRVCTDAVTAAMEPAELPGVVELNRAILQFMEQAVAAVAGGYERFGRTSLAEQAASSQLLVNALVEGGDPREAARRAGVALPSAYLVLSLAVGPHADETDPAVDPVVAGRRKLRRLREELERQYADPVLWVPATEGGLALVPFELPSDTTPGLLPGPVWTRLERVVADLARAAGAQVHAGVASAEPERVPAAVELSREVLDVAVRLGRPGGVFRLADVALDYQLTRASQAHPVLAELLSPLDAHPDLADTLAVFLETGLNRRRSASRLHVHPNTVDNRLRRIAGLTGLDPASPADLPSITAAMAARRTR